MKKEKAYLLGECIHFSNILWGEKNNRRTFFDNSVNKALRSTFKQKKTPSFFFSSYPRFFFQHGYSITNTESKKNCVQR